MLSSLADLIALSCTQVGDVVLRNMPVVPKEAKFAFILLPAEVRFLGCMGRIHPLLHA